VKQRLVIVGGDAAGMSAASQARRLQPDLEIVAFERGSHVSYSACGEPYFVGGLVDSIDDLVARTPEQFAEMNIGVRLHHEVTQIDLDRGAVTVRSFEDDSVSTVGFDHLMYATGSRPLRPDDIEGIHLPGVVGLRTLDDAVHLKEQIESGVKRVAVLGGGYIGLEVAESLIGRGLAVTMITSGEHVLEKRLDAPIGALANQAVRDIGVDLHTGLRVECIRGEEQAAGIGCEDNDFPADLVVIGLGIEPEVDLARDAGIPLGDTGAVAVDDRQETGIEGVWSGGDCAETTHRISGLQVNIALGTVANKTGRIAGTNIANSISGESIDSRRDARFPGALGTAITSVGRIEIACTGLKVEDARLAGFDPVVGLATGTTTAGYWPGAERMDLMVISDRSDGRLLGAQIVGGRGAGKKIDVLATAMWARMTASELSWVDLAYAPPFSGVWDLIHIAARRAAERK
jgi:NADPH-dependent 2,4-dienoyl-CoA reductase/sulfur reductase-like enzyme